MLTRFKFYLDSKLVPAWRVWWKLWSMRLGAAFAVLMTYLTAAPQAFNEALAMFPPWLRDSLPFWVGPVGLALLFLVRFWNQKKVPSNEEIRTPPGSQGS